jgi:hypothetical protein
VEAAEDADEEPKLSSDERRFYDAYSEHWVHADKRVILTEYLCRAMVNSLKG